VIVNAIGNYSGTVLFDATALTHSVAFKIETGGAWTIKVEPVSSARAWSGSGKLSGAGDDVIRLTTPPSGLTTATLTHAGKANFIVYAYTSDGLAAVRANEIGHFSGQVQLPDGTVLLAVTADGAWTVTPDA